jgi:hypothetical protein
MKGALNIIIRSIPAGMTGPGAEQRKTRKETL